MRRRAFLTLTGATLLAPGAEADEPPPPVVDLHVDLSYQLNYEGQGIDRASGNLLADELTVSGYVGLVLPLYIPHDVSKDGPRAADLEQSYRRLIRELRQRPPFASPGTARGSRPVQTWLSFEGAAPLAGATARQIASWVARGVRLFGLVHMYDNVLASSSGRTASFRSVPRGLTEAGRKLVEKVHEIGGSVDVSHASDATVDDVLEMARSAGSPVVATHSNARVLARHSRNLDDGRLRAIGESGGVVGVNFHGPYLVTGRRAQMTDVVRHIQHLVNVAGVEHVAIGSDFEGGIQEPPGLEDVRGLPRLAALLKAEGLPRDTVERIFAKNALRVLAGR